MCGRVCGPDSVPEGRSGGECREGIEKPCNLLPDGSRLEEAVGWVGGVTRHPGGFVGEACVIYREGGEERHQ